jgi:hypothetical protein
MLFKQACDCPAASRQLLSLADFKANVSHGALESIARPSDKIEGTSVIFEDAMRREQERSARPQDTVLQYLSREDKIKGFGWCIHPTVLPNQEIYALCRFQIGPSIVCIGEKRPVGRSPAAEIKDLQWLRACVGL